MPQLASVGRLMGPREGGGAAVTPGAFDAMQLLQPAYALYGVQRLVSSATYTGFAYRIRRSSDNADMDFLPGALSLDVAAWIAAAGAATGYMTIIYDQSGNGRNSVTGTSGTAGTAPSVDCSVGVYPVAVHNGTSNRWSLSALVNLNTTALGISHGVAVQATAAPSATAFVQICEQNASGSSRTSIDMLTTPTWSARATRVNGGSLTASFTPTSWSLLPSIVMSITDYSVMSVNRYVNNVQGTPATTTALVPAYTASAGVYIGGSNLTNFAPMRWTCSSFYDVAVAGATRTAWQSALETAA